MKPSPLVVKALTKVGKVVPKWKIVPIKNVIDSAFKNPDFREEVSLPFLVVHGGDDIVTDPTMSQTLYEEAASKDKTFKLYPGMWHALTSGESRNNLDIVFSDIISWLNDRAMVIKLC
ncbi:hypothetical protein AXF42_Ash008148 [Apostasia shenzhenica]|uniref:Serine aminopeptidase S33 domain-containing protein n=1 Tax=Apostasia shenzhenica TaxID=1088818 RepID=A0A2I0A8N8_9ASPA|nr:hypothetical protein AXF42_Ash008148 [Apostasia shenzhenica]